MTARRHVIAAVSIAACLVGPGGLAAMPARCEFEASTRIELGNGSTADGDLSTNESGSTVHLGRRAMLTDGTRIRASQVTLLNGASVFDVESSMVNAARDAVIRGTLLRLDSSPEAAFCAGVSLGCSGSDVRLRRGDAPRTLTSGAYGTLTLENGTAVTLNAGDYSFCGIRTGRHATIAIVDPASSTIAVAGTVRLENGSRFGDPAATSVVSLIVGGDEVKAGAGSALAAAVHAPRATLHLGRGATLAGVACAARIAAGRGATLACRAMTMPSTSTSSTVPTTSPPTTTSGAPTTSTSSTTTTVVSTTTTSSSTPTSTSTATTSSSTTMSTPTTVPTTSTSTLATTSSTSSTTSTSLPTTTSTTAPIVTTTSSTIASTSTTVVPTTSTVATTSTTSSTATTTSAPATTTSTTLPGPVVCGANGVDAVVSVPYGRAVPALAAVTIDLRYPAALSIPGNGFDTEERSSDLTGLDPTLLSVDRDANNDTVDDTLRIIYALVGGRTFPPGPLAAVWFDCNAGSLVGPTSFTCVVQDGSDAGGTSVPGTLIPCGVTQVTLHP